MKKSRFTEGQIMAILKQHEVGVPVADLLRARHQHSPDLLVALEVWRHGRIDDEAAERTGV